MIVYVVVFFIKNTAHSVRDHADLVVVPERPYQMRNGEKKPLEKQHERHPLVVRMVSSVWIGATESGFTKIINVVVFVLAIGHRKSASDQAIRVDDILRNAVAARYTTNGFTWELKLQITIE